MIRAAAPALVEPAPAKVNLTLRIVGRRADGYHLLDSLVAFADVGERLVLAPSRKTELLVEGGAPADPDDLVLRTDAAFRARYRVPPVRYRLTKRIPVAAGLGGGSADAAAALRGLARLAGIETGLPEALAAELGADVPVCVSSRAARMAGIGEPVAPVELPVLFAVLVHPAVALQTRDVFDAFDESGSCPATPTRPTALLAEIVEGRNDLEAAARGLAPSIGEVIERIAGTEGCLAARMTGSGATCFGLYRRRGQADAAGATITADRTDWWVRAVALG